MRRGRRRIVDDELDALTAIPAIVAEVSSNVKRRTVVSEQELGERRIAGAERNRLGARAIGSNQSAAEMLALKEA